MLCVVSSFIMTYPPTPSLCWLVLCLFDVRSYCSRERCVLFTVNRASNIRPHISHYRRQVCAIDYSDSNKNQPSQVGTDSGDREYRFQPNPELIEASDIIVSFFVCSDSAASFHPNLYLYRTGWPGAEEGVAPELVLAVPFPGGGDDDGGDGGGAACNLLSHRFQAGSNRTTYSLFVDGQSHLDEGAFDLKIRSHLASTDSLVNDLEERVINCNASSSLGEGDSGIGCLYEFEGTTASQPSILAEHPSGEHFYRFHVVATSLLRLTTCGGITEFDTILRVFRVPGGHTVTGAGASLVSLTEVASNDNADDCGSADGTTKSSAVQSSVVFLASAGDTLVVAVEGQTFAEGRYTLTIHGQGVVALEDEMPQSCSNSITGCSFYVDGSTIDVASVASGTRALPSMLGNPTPDSFFLLSGRGLAALSTCDNRTSFNAGLTVYEVDRMFSHAAAFVEAVSSSREDVMCAGSAPTRSPTAAPHVASSSTPTLTPSSGTRCCNTYVVSGVTTQQHRSGIFKDTGLVVDNRPVFQNTEGEYLFFDSSGGPTWFIGPEYGTTVAHIRAESDASACPPSGDYEVYSDGVWGSSSDTVAVVCAACCDTYIVSGAETAQPLRSGSFQDTGIVVEDRPVFRNVEGEYLFFGSSNEPSWFIGPDYGTTVAGIRVESDASVCPPSSGYEVYTGGVWDSAAHAVTVACAAPILATCEADKVIEGIADILLADGSAFTAGLNQLQCEAECRAAELCRIYVFTATNGYCELWTVGDIPRTLEDATDKTITCYLDEGTPVPTEAPTPGTTCEIQVVAPVTVPCYFTPLWSLYHPFAFRLVYLFAVLDIWCNPPILSSHPYHNCHTSPVFLYPVRNISMGAAPAD
jgi:hypothetical protein